MKANRDGRDARVARSRWISLLCGGLVVACGLLVRSHRLPLSPFFVKYGGDLLWAMLVFYSFAFLRPFWSWRHLGAAALSFSYLVEFSQLYHAPWLDHLREFRLIAVVLGSTFHWPDFIAYTGGIAVAVAMDAIFFCRSGNRV